MNDHNEFTQRLIKFLAAAQAKVDARLKSYGGNTIAMLEASSGPKYIRVTCREIYANGETHGGYAYCFIDLATGHVWKPAGYKGPERKNPRSCIFDDDYGASGVTGYGTTYLR